MRSIFRAFAWMRWRIFVNSLERTGSREALDRFSIAIEKLGPVMALILLIPSSLMLLVLGLAAGFGLGTGAWEAMMQIVRVVMFLALAVTLVGPLILPSRDSAGILRLLLLPIPRQLLYAAQTASALADPWVLMVVPLVAGVSFGLAIGLRFAAASIAAAAGVVFLLIVVGVTSLASSLIHLVLRDRRRGDLAMLIFIVVLPLAGVLPQLLIPAAAAREGGRRLTPAERRALPATRAAVAARRLLPLVPSELYTTATRRATTSPAGAVLPLVGLAAIALAAHAGAFAAYRRVLDVPTTISARRAGTFGGLWNRTIPGLTPGGSAVAFAQLRLALRSPRGRATIVSPLITPILLGFVFSRAGGGRLPFDLDASRGLAVAAVGCYTSLLGLLPIAVNQFAVEGAGFTREMLSPLSVRELLAGKAVGNALIAAGPALLTFALARAVFPGGAVGSWVALLLSAVATYCLFAPAAAVLSALFPKEADLNSIGNSGNAHQAAGLLGIASFAAAAAPGLLLSLVAGWFRRGDLVSLLMLGWCAVAFGISQAAYVPVRTFVASRCEAITQYH